MTTCSRHDRTLRLLATRLEVLALAGERNVKRKPELEPYVLGAAAATRNAVRLELISAEEASRIWADVSARHPEIRWAKDGPSLAA